MHNNNSHNKWMGIFMAICCGLPVLIAVAFSSFALNKSLQIVTLTGAIALCLLLHYVIMKKSHKNNGNKDDNNSDNTNHDNSRSGMGCH